MKNFTNQDESFEHCFKEIEKKSRSLSNEDLINRYEALKNKITKQIIDENSKDKQKTVTALFVAIENLKLQAN